jgi:hypothetical protein
VAATGLISADEQLRYYRGLCPTML